MSTKSTKDTKMDEKEILGLCDRVRQAAFDLHTFLRNGHLEKVYKNGLVYRLRKKGLKVEQQHPLQVRDGRYGIG